jgi:hypothetical protein
VKTFLHGGDFGDLIYALPAIRALGGGALYLSEAHPGREPLTAARRDVLLPLLERIDYLAAVRLPCHRIRAPYSFPAGRPTPPFDLRTRPIGDGRRAHGNVGDPSGRERLGEAPDPLEERLGPTESGVVALHGEVSGFQRDDAENRPCSPPKSVTS